jgi:hypothetical protein
VTARGLVGVLAIAVSLTVAPAAQAHIHSGLAAVDYRAKTFPLRGLRQALTISIYKTDRALRLTVRPGHTVTVVGYVHEPFIRVGRDRVMVNKASPTAAAAGLLREPQRPDSDSQWILHSRGQTVVWHSAGLRGLPPGLSRAAWRVPLIVDGRPAALAGEIWRVPAPSLWPWLLLGTPFALAVAWIVVRARDRLRPAAAILGVVAAASVVAAAAAFALAGSATEGRWVEGANELVFALAGTIVLARGTPNARALAAGGLGLLALAVGLGKLPVLLHGVVLSAFPATATRLAVSVAIWAGAAASALGLVAFFEILDEPQSAPTLDQRPRAWERALD